MHTLSESKSIFAIEQKAIVERCCAFIGTPGIYIKDMEVIVFLYHLTGREFISPQNNKRPDMFFFRMQKESE